jgi:hypothetical protein
LRKLFPGYYKPTKAEFEDLWKTCIFTFDANVLLHIYRYTPETRERLFVILEHLEDRIWIPHQAAYEFSKNRPEVIIRQSTVYDKIEQHLNRVVAQLEEELAHYKKHPFFGNSEAFAEHIRAGVQRASAAITEAKKGQPDIGEDELLDRLSALLDGRIGPPFPQERLDEIYQEGAKRYAQKTPPGYEDAKDKTGNDQYGDLVLWFQVIEQAKSEKKPIVLTTDDTKEDWWWESSGKTIGSRPELVSEMLHKAGVAFHMYKSERFIDLAQGFLNLRDNQAIKAVEEAQAVRQQEDFMSSIDNRTGIEAYRRMVGWLKSRGDSDAQLDDTSDSIAGVPVRIANRLGMELLLTLGRRFRGRVASLLIRLWDEGARAPITGEALVEELRRLNIDIPPGALTVFYEAFEELGCIRAARFMDAEGVSTHGAITILDVNPDCIRYWIDELNRSAH